jgi:hypothetical protein
MEEREEQGTRWEEPTRLTSAFGWAGGAKRIEKRKEEREPYLNILSSYIAQVN